MTVSASVGGTWIRRPTKTHSMDSAHQRRAVRARRVLLGVWGWLRGNQVNVLFVEVNKIGINQDLDRFCSHLEWTTRFGHRWGSLLKLLHLGARHFLLSTLNSSEGARPLPTPLIAAGAPGLLLGRGARPPSEPPPRLAPAKPGLEYSGYARPCSRA